MHFFYFFQNVSWLIPNFHLRRRLKRSVTGSDLVYQILDLFVIICRLMYMHSMIISHITYCLTTWSQASITTLKPLESLYKQSLKTLDKKSVQFHHCSILKKYNLLSWDNLIKYVHICLLFKTMHSLSSPLKQFVNIRTTAHRSARGGERGDCIIPFKISNFSQSVFSVKAAREWNSIPSTIRRLHTFGSFQSHLKKWLLTTQHCQH